MMGKAQYAGLGIICTFTMIALMISAVIPLASAQRLADDVHKCDQVAAHPGDPNRMAQGASMDRVIPGLALKTCRDAVAEYPDEPRFQYQLGRAYKSSGDLPSAIKHYRRAADLRYPMAFFNLGYLAVEPNTDFYDPHEAVKYFKKARELGITFAQWYIEYLIWNTDGYSNPDLFMRIYQGSLHKEKIDQSKFASYAVSFFKKLNSFYLVDDGRKLDRDGCRNQVSTAALMKAANHTAVRTFGQLLGTLGKAQRDGTTGFQETQRWTMGVVTSARAAQKDAKLFFQRYSFQKACDSPVARRFLAHMNKYLASLGTPSFRREIEKVYE